MKRVIAIATNSGPTLHYGQTGLWLSELTHFTHELQRAGHRVDIASPTGGKIPLDANSIKASALKDPANVAFLSDPRMKATLDSSLAASDIDPASYDVLYLSGGHGTMWDFRQSPALQRLITAMSAAGKLLSGVCHGVCGFIDSVDVHGRSLVAGKRVTGFSNFEDRLAGSLKHMPYLLETELVAKGAVYRKNFLPFMSRVEEDGALLTGQNPQSVKALALQVLKRL
ncbi:MAG: type 1 glutamine amidotransferase domain-containing protein [Myxococcales bacterium]|nr:type 1 glutamine amidotransferase domain-containing protein [Myxococcales bacterium]